MTDPESDPESDVSTVPLVRVERGESYDLVYRSRAGGVVRVPVAIRDASSPSCWVVAESLGTTRGVEYRVCGWEAPHYDAGDVLHYDPDCEAVQTRVGTFVTFQGMGDDARESVRGG